VVETVDTMAGEVRLVAHRLADATEWPLRAARLQRAWMDSFPDRWP
jgi:hypothetical protein